MNRGAAPGHGPARDSLFWKGKPFVPVSAVLENILAKPGLVEWSAETVARQALRDPEALRRLAELDPAAAERFLLAAPRSERQRAARRGNLVHRLAAQLARGRRVRAEGEAAAFLEVLSGFLRRERPKFIWVEPELFSGRYGYGGRADAIVRLGGRTLVLEYKTGERVYPEDRLQLAAYGFADFIGLTGGREVRLPRIDGGLIVRVGYSGYELLPVTLHEADFLAFLHALYLYRWLKGASSA